MNIGKACERFADDFLVRPGHPARLRKRDPGEHYALGDVPAADALQAASVRRIADLARVLWASAQRSVLIVLQGMDTAGKDGAIRHLLTGVNPQCCDVHAFKTPTADELAHDFLWRVHARCPARGRIGVFNRSHYEDVLIVRVHNLVPKKAWSARYDQINAFEELLVSSGTLVLKFFLHISKAEQKRRLEARLKDPDARWKMNPDDLKERRRWDDYTEAYEDALTKCSTHAAPWRIVPADHKWFRNLAIAQIVADQMQAMGLTYPEPTFDPAAVKVK
jgi:PPK2 family polyphosphate:nucleotide phosphotransferase